MEETKTGCVEVAPGVELFYREQGKGPVLLLTSGWTFSSEIFGPKSRGIFKTGREGFHHMQKLILKGPPVGVTGAV